MKENPYEPPLENKPRWWRGRSSTVFTLWPFWVLLLIMAVAILIADLLHTIRTP